MLNFINSMARPVFGLFALCCLLSQPLFANKGDISGICDSAAIIASRESGVPVEVLRAISLTETGRKLDGRLQAWPWTVNMEGVGKWFDDVGQARKYVDRHFERGARSFDVGCFQINFKWHGHAFASIDDMFDPMTNARYAARFLGELYEEFGDWSRAAGAYHSRTPKFAKRYTARFDRIRSNLDELPDVFTSPVTRSEPSVPSAPIPAKTNSYPFLVSSRPAGGASLVPSIERKAGLLDNTTARPLVEMQ